MSQPIATDAASKRLAAIERSREIMQEHKQLRNDLRLAKTEYVSNIGEAYNHYVWLREYSHVSTPDGLHLISEAEKMIRRGLGFAIRAKNMIPTLAAKLAAFDKAYPFRRNIVYVDESPEEALDAQYHAAERLYAENSDFRGYKDLRLYSKA